MHIKLNAFSIYDNKVNAYGPPIYFMNVLEAKADLAMSMKMAGDKINPTDYELFELGEFDSESGKHKLLDKPTHVCNMRTLVLKEKEIA